MPPAASLTTGAADELYVRNTIRDLSRYSMVTLHGRDFGVHGLVQTVEQHQTPEDKRPAWIETVCAMLTACAPENAHDPNTWVTWDRLRPHAERLWEQSEQDERVALSSDLMTGLEHLFFGKGVYDRALAACQAGLRVDEARRGPNDPSIEPRLVRSWPIVEPA